MDTILDVSVSCFADYNSTTSYPVNLNVWLTSNKYADKVEAIRKISDKDERDAIKSTLPCITPSGTFSKREARCLTTHSGFIQFDIDAKGNESITDYTELKQAITRIKNIAYCGLSVSGQGLWGLVPIAFPEKHTQHFLALEKAFAKVGIILDAKPKSIVSLRGYSYDPDGYFNHNATTFTVLIEPPKPKPSTYKPTGTDDRAKVERAINDLAYDVTGDYQTWFEIGCSLANAFGEDGREYFHSVSRWHPNYTPTETDRQYTHCLKHTYSFTLGTFFHYVKYNAPVSDYKAVQVKQMAPKPVLSTIDKTDIKKELEFALDGTPIGVKGYPVSWDLNDN